MSAFFRFALCFFVFALGLQAFPPAPYYTLYGLVRNQVGQVLDVDGAVLILLKDNVEVGRTPITSPQVDKNYELKVRIDLNRPGTSLYTKNAVVAGGLFSLVVEMNGAFFYPIEVSGDLNAGIGAERTRLDLNLGVDSDGDRLPDAWEQWQLYQAGLFPDNLGVWPIDLIDRDGDYDSDGTSNYFEYVAGTFAGDATESFSLAIKEKTVSRVRFEFYAITGKTYRIERSAALGGEDWLPVPFTIGAPGVGETVYQAGGVGVLSAFVIPVSNSKEFYRLTVR
jgi:hypothetical protein